MNLSQHPAQSWDTFISPTLISISNRFRKPVQHQENIFEGASSKDFLDLDFPGFVVEISNLRKINNRENLTKKEQFEFEMAGSECP